MKMNKRQQEIENIRKELINDYIKDDVNLYIRFSDITRKLWLLSHTLTVWQSFKIKVYKFIRVVEVN